MTTHHRCRSGVEVSEALRVPLDRTNPTLIAGLGSAMKAIGKLKRRKRISEVQRQLGRESGPLQAEK
jgi:hypothetical protein